MRQIKPAKLAFGRTLI